MNGQNLAYALTQVFHNFGAVTVAGSAAFAVWFSPLSAVLQRKLASGIALGWAVQGVTGALFGGISYYNYGRFPDIHGIAVDALWVKVICAVAGFVLAADFLRRGAAFSERQRKRRWWALSGLAATALSAAAFLRWFS